MAFTRRKFVQLSSATGASLLLSSLDSFALTNKPNFTMNAGFQLKVLATNWGFDGSLDSYCAKAKKEGSGYHSKNIRTERLEKFLDERHI